MNRLLSALLSSCVVLAPTMALPQSASPAISVESISSTTNCSIYVSYWGDWILSICNRQFPDIKTRLRSAIVEAFEASSTSPTLRLPASLVLTGQISGMTAGANSISDTNFCLSDQTVSATLDWQAKGPGSGQTLAGTAEKTVDIGYRSVTGPGVGMNDCELQPAAKAAFDKLQTEIARTAARAIVVRYNPIKVTAVDSRGRVQLNYGKPVLEMGSMVSIGGRNSFPTRYEIVTTGPGFAWAKPYGSAGDIFVGDEASMIEADSSEANARRTEFAPLP
jgi:hypothetical protein